MNEQQYNDLAKGLKQQLNEKCALVTFHVPNATEFLIKYAPENQKEPDRFAVEYRVKINDFHLATFSLLSVEMVTDTYIDIIDFIIEKTANDLSYIILHPDTVKGWPIASTSP